MRIYEYAMGGKTIVPDLRFSPCNNNCHPGRYRCHAWVPKSWLEDKLDDRLSSLEQVSEQNELVTCFSEPWEWYGDYYGFDLLLVCRRIYNEAVLVPFRANDFGFYSKRFEYWHRERPEDTFYSMTFLRDLVPEQRQAISTLCIRGAVKYRFKQQDIDALSGLRYLKLGLNYSLTRIQEAPKKLIEAVEDHFNSGGLTMFRSVALKEVEIVAELSVWHDDGEAVLAQSKELAEWVESKRALLLSK